MRSITRIARDQEIIWSWGRSWCMLCSSDCIRKVKWVRFGQEPHDFDRSTIPTRWGDWQSNGRRNRSRMPSTQVGWQRHRSSGKDHLEGLLAGIIMFEMIPQPLQKCASHVRSLRPHSSFVIYCRTHFKKFSLKMRKINHRAWLDSRATSTFKWSSDSAFRNGEGVLDSRRRTFSTRVSLL